MPTLNERAHELASAMVDDADQLGIVVGTLACGTRIIDCGVKAPGSIEAGLRLAKICMSGQGWASIRPLVPRPKQRVQVAIPTDPVAACMASQYAGWEIKGDKYFAMGSGPMRAAAGREALFESIGRREQPNVCVGVLETAKLPPESVCLDVAEKCRVAPLGLLAGSKQVEGKPAIAIPLKVTNGAMMLGPLKIGEIPPLF